jgi:predicted nuclease of restriction endonuclease-like RecB superfamily
MLPSTLLVARKHRDTISPVYAALNDANRALAKRLVQAYQDHLTKRKRAVEAVIAELEAQGHDYRFVRGLATLLERRCRLDVEAAVTPKALRSHLFHATSSAGIPVTPQARGQLLREAAQRYAITVPEVEASLYADLDEELVLTAFTPIDADALLRQYNLSLTQTLLFRSSTMEFTASENWQQIFRRIRWLGLIYTIQRRKEGYWVTVDGPLSLFKLGHRYGSRLAQLVPPIIASRDWSIHAQVLRRQSDQQLLHLTLDSRNHATFLKAGDPKAEVDVAYDSRVEAEFAQRFTALRSGWRLTREPGPLAVGRQVMLPDFLFEKEGLRVYLEIAGFWTPTYLQHKLQQLEGVENVDMIVAADRANACQQLDRLGRRLNVVYYRGKVPLRPILNHLTAKAAALRETQRLRLRGRELSVEGPATTTAALAEQLGVLEEAVTDVLRDRGTPGYRLLGDVLISEATLHLIEEQLTQRTEATDLTLTAATQLIEALGGIRPTRILEALGYGIEWHGIDPSKARLRKKSGIA